FLGRSARSTWEPSHRCEGIERPGGTGWKEVWVEAALFFPVHGYGRSEWETRVRGLWGVRVAGRNRRLAKEEGFHAVRQSPESIARVPSKEQGYKERMELLLKGKSSLDEELLHVQAYANPLRVEKESPSMFSSGRLAPDGQRQVGSGKELHKLAQATLDTVWEQAVEDDVRSLRQLALSLSQPTRRQRSPEGWVGDGSIFGAQAGASREGFGGWSPSLGGGTQRSEEASQARGEGSWRRSAAGSFPPLTQPCAKMRPNLAGQQEGSLQKRKREWYESQDGVAGEEAGSSQEEARKVARMRGARGRVSGD
ncbi:hypothetical protein FRC06_006250, partial [Ceratobasidium sp. 370]